MTSTTERSVGGAEAGATGRELLERASRLMPGGVSSPVRAFGSVGGTALFIDHAVGERVWDVDEREYVDYIQSWGALLLGHAHPAIVSAVCDAAARGTSFGASSSGELQLAELVNGLMPAVEMVRFVNSGTEATMSAVRLARAATGRDRILKFSGCYHGHADSFLVKAGSGVATLGLPDSPGVPRALAELTLTVAFNDLDAVRDTLAAQGDDVACVIVEPAVGNSGFIPPLPGFLEGLRAACDEHGCLLIFDEVMTGFRVAPGGAQERWGVRPDLTTLGKVIGGGLPVGAYGGRRDLMERVAPAGPVYQAGTLSGNPLAMAAGVAQLLFMREEAPHAALEARARRLVDGLAAAARPLGVPFWGDAAGAMFGYHFVDGPVTSFEQTARVDRDFFARFHAAAMRRGILLPPSPFEAAFMSTAHDDDCIEETLCALAEALGEAAA